MAHTDVSIGVLPVIKIFLFGQFILQLDECTLDPWNCPRAKELFCYLILFQARPQNREQLAGIFWGDYPSAISKKYLRKYLWQLLKGLNEISQAGLHDILFVDPGWVQFNIHSQVWADTYEFEQVFIRNHGVRGRELSVDNFKESQWAVNLYRGDLLEGWYQDWCIFERERFRDMYFVLLEKLMGYCEANGLYEQGIDYGHKILSCDRAREWAHLRLMRLYHYLGDRTAAIRQFEACKEALQKELDVGPSNKTISEYNAIVEDHQYAESALANAILDSNINSISYDQVLERVIYLLSLEEAVHRKILEEIKLLKK